MNVLVTGRLPEEVMFRLKGEHKVEAHEEDLPMERRALLDQVQDKEGLLCMITDQINTQLLDKAPKLKMIANYGVGINNIDLDAVTRRKIPVSNTPDVLTDATADLAFALILCTARRVVEGDRRTREGKFRHWVPFYFMGREVSGQTLGIIGLGRIGKAVARRAKGFDMRILYHNRRRIEASEEETLGVTYVNMKTLLVQSDFVSLHVPLTDETNHLIGPKELGAMKPNAFLINTSRGAVVDEQALVEVLQSGKIAGAGLDVYEHEPSLAPGLVESRGTVLLPHMGSATLETRTKMAEKAAENLLVGLRGQRPPDCLNWQQIS